MKNRSLHLVAFMVLFPIFACSCGINSNILYKEFYSDVIGFSDNDELYKPTPKDEILMLENKDYRAFKDKYFTQREIPIKDPDESKAVLYIQIPSKSFLVDNYKIQSITGYQSKITVKLSKSGSTNVDPIPGFNGKTMFVMFLELDKSSIRENTEIVVRW